MIKDILMGYFDLKESKRLKNVYADIPFGVLQVSKFFSFIVFIFDTQGCYAHGSHLCTLPGNEEGWHSGDSKR
jgi:hypothetical protein